MILFLPVSLYIVSQLNQYATNDLNFLTVKTSTNILLVPLFTNIFTKLFNRDYAQMIAYFFYQEDQLVSI